MSNLRTLELAVEIVSTFVVTNKIAAKALPELIGSVHEALKIPAAVSRIPVEKRNPAVPVGKSVTPDYIICLEDGRRFKSMRHHLKRLGMTPEDYRKKWGVAFRLSGSCAELCRQTIGIGEPAKPWALAREDQDR